MELKLIEDFDDYKLCYVDNGMAWFTKKDLKEQWGDDWDDIPYEHNAYDPYEDEGSPLVRVCYFSHKLLTPAEKGTRGSLYSVRDINSGAIAWLSNYKGISIYAGAGICEFIEKVAMAGGEVFMRVEIKNK